MYVKMIVLIVDTVEHGLVDYIGFAGYDPKQQSWTSFPLPFSISLKQTPSLLSFVSCMEDTENIPNRIEWFCLPSN